MEQGSSTRKPVVIFNSYAHKDVKFLNELHTCLEHLKQNGLIESWHDGQIPVGTDWEKCIHDHLDQAEIIVFLVSQNLLGSQYVREVELPFAINLKEKGKAEIVPIIIRKSDYGDSPLGRYQSVPKPEKPIEKYRPKSEGWILVLNRLKALCQRISYGISEVPLAAVVEQPLIARVPPPDTPPVGRDDLIEDMTKYLLSHRSLAVTGIAGVGKTTVLRAAMSKVAQLENRSYDVICYHRMDDLSPEVDMGKREDEAMRRLLAHLLVYLRDSGNARLMDPESMVNRVSQLAFGRYVLLGIDNADDVACRRAAQRIYNLLPEITLAVSSRYGKWRDFRVIRLDGISNPAGVALFEQMSSQVLEETGRKSIDELCKRVAGHPMAITYYAKEYVRGSGSIQELLRDSSKFSPERDLYNLFRTTCSQLQPECGEILNLIGSLATSSIRIDMIEKVAKVKPDYLETMADLFLVHLHPGMDHFTVHELIRHWCRDEVSASDMRKIQDRLSQYYIRHLRNLRQKDSGELIKMDAEWPNILRLIDTLEDRSAVLALVDEAIGDHFDDPNGYAPSRGQTQSLLDREERILELADTGGHRPQAQKASGLSEDLKARIALEARLRKNLGHFHYWRNDLAKAENLFSRAMELYRSIDDAVGEICTIWLLGYIKDDINDYPEAQKKYEEGFELAKDGVPSSKALYATGCHLIGCTLYHQGLFREAKSKFELAYKHAADLGDPDLLARIERRLGAVSLRLDDLPAVEGWFTKATEHAKARPRDMARLHRQTALLYLKQNRLDAAEAELVQAYNAFLEQGNPRGIGYTQHGWAVLRRLQGRLEEARKLCEDSRQIAEKNSSLYGQAAAFEELAAINAAFGGHDIQQPNLRRACHIYQVIGHDRGNSLNKEMDRNKSMQCHIQKSCKGVMFDLMDTLAYMPKGIYEDTQKKFVKRLGVSFERFDHAWKLKRKMASEGEFASTAARMKAVAEYLEVPWENILQELVALEDSMWADNVYLYSDPRNVTVDLLNQLRQLGLRIAIVSNGPVAMSVLPEKLGIKHLVDAFVLSCEARSLKPDEGIYRAALERLNVPAADCVYIGDGNDHELDGAGKIGMYTMKIKRPDPPYAHLKSRSLDWDCEVEDLNQIAALFQCWSESRK